ncbi:MAG: hypothetical protein ACREJU_17770 [Nitrospiraceae bacterium]
MRSLVSLFIGLLCGAAMMLYFKAGAVPLPTTAPVNAAEAVTEQKSGAPLGPEDLLSEAEVYDHEADQIQAEVMQYKRNAASINPLADPKGFRRAGLTTAAASKSKAVAELRQLAAHHRTEANRMMAKHSPQ